jgi:hypothetical protein
MKKILLSLLTIVVVGGAVASATGAFYNDTETSAGNIFVAGSIDLKVDHTAQTYNGVDCKTCRVEVYSLDDGDTVIEKNGNSITSYPAVHAWVHPNWMTELSFDPSGKAKWIWEQNPTQLADTQVNTSYTFQKTFQWMGPISATTLDLALGSDNMYTVYLNGNQIGQDLNENNFSSADHITTIPAAYFNQGTNILKFVVTNKGVQGSNSQSNPAGLIYKLTINGNCGDAYFQNHCSLWQATDLTNQTFFNFDDVKPGDTGTNLISLHVDTNDAYACLMVKNPKDEENTHLVPETLAGDTTVGPLNGELSNDLNVAVWNDTTSNGVHDAGEVILYQGGIDTELIQLSLTGGGPTSYVGLAWCAGTQTATTAVGPITCNGAGMSNQAQTDSFMADVVAYGIQQRNNQGFDCHNVVFP